MRMPCQRIWLHLLWLRRGVVVGHTGIDGAVAIDHTGLIEHQVCGLCTTSTCCIRCQAGVSAQTYARHTWQLNHLAAGFCRTEW